MTLVQKLAEALSECLHWSTINQFCPKVLYWRGLIAEGRRPRLPEEYRGGVVTEAHSRGEKL